MKKIAVVLMATFMMSATVPVLAAEMTKEEKDQCLLASKNCMNEVNSIQQKMKKLQAEIKKGKKVYSAAELQKLQQKLKEAEDMIDALQNENKK
jgi:septal ring factor EnvC (AmiA/AmiB activator)